MIFSPGSDVEAVEKRGNSLVGESTEEPEIRREAGIRLLADDGSGHTREDPYGEQHLRDHSTHHAISSFAITRAFRS